MKKQANKRKQVMNVAKKWCIIGNSYFTFSSKCTACDCDPCDCHWGTNEIKEE